ncbi:MAG TPA: hypothetical protein VMR33_16520 [Candidatus Baltobacteraceae bacterium]|jgi:hypothetical protein|nr:hypothetical protein [Candidatus Baltobacteraceae bacterium]
MRDPKQVGYPKARRQAAVIRAEIEDLKEEELDIQEEATKTKDSNPVLHKKLLQRALRKANIRKAKEQVALDFETEGLSPQAAARWVREKSITDKNQR